MFSVKQTTSTVGKFDLPDSALARPKRFKITWQTFDVNQVEVFRDPTWECYIPRDEFIQIYGKLLETLDGGDMSSYVDFFFRPSPVNKTMYEFVDEDCRLDFREMAEEMKLIPSFKEVMEGEDETEKIKRNLKEKTKIVTKPVILSQTERIQQTVSKITKRLENETEPAVIKQLEEKLARTLKLAQTTQ